MRRLAIVACAALGACSAAAQQKIATTIQNAQAVTPTAIKSTCAALSFADMAFKIAVGPMKIGAADQATEADVMANVDKVCAQAPQDASAALAFLLSASQAIGTGSATGSVPAVAPPPPAAVTPAAVAPASG